MGLLTRDADGRVDGDEQVSRRCVGRVDNLVDRSINEVDVVELAVG